jgi:hypothetical protein
VIHVPDRPNVHVRLAAVELLFSHFPSPSQTNPNSESRNPKFLFGAHDQI